MSKPPKDGEVIQEYSIQKTPDSDFMYSIILNLKINLNEEKLVKILEEWHDKNE